MGKTKAKKTKQAACGKMWEGKDRPLLDSIQLNAGNELCKKEKKEGCLGR